MCYDSTTQGCFNRYFHILLHVSKNFVNVFPLILTPLSISKVLSSSSRTTASAVVILWALFCCFSSSSVVRENEVTVICGAKHYFLQYGFRLCMELKVYVFNYESILEISRYWKHETTRSAAFHSFSYSSAEHKVYTRNVYTILL